MKHYISLLALAATIGCQAQTFTIQTSTPRQTIQHFGASDAWSMQFIGLWDNEAEQQKIADSYAKIAEISADESIDEYEKASMIDGFTRSVENREKGL